jgi:hypothetical protein
VRRKTKKQDKKIHLNFLSAGAERPKFFRDRIFSEKDAEKAAERR